MLESGDLSSIHMATMANAAKLPNIQILRALAATSVVLGHATAVGPLLAHSSVLNSGGLLALFAQCGVDIFFVISGFIMVLVAGDKFGEPGAAKTFLVKRAVRVLPLYWACTAAMCLLLLVPGAFASMKATVAFVVASFFLIPMKQPWSADVYPLVGPGWTLTYEMYFYGLFALALVGMRLKTFVVTIWAFFVACVSAGFILSPGNPIFSMITNPILLEFALGCTAGYIFVTKPISATFAKVGLVIGSIILLSTYFFPFPIKEYRFLFWGVPSFFIVLGAACTQQSASAIGRIFMDIGNASYSLYLTHPFFHIVVSWAIKRGYIPTTANADLLVITRVIVPLLIALAVYRLFEAPVTRYLTKQVSTQRAAPAFGFRVSATMRANNLNFAKAAPASSKD